MPQKRRMPVQGELLLSSSLPFVLLKGLLLALAISLSIIVLSALLAYFSPLPEFVVPYLIFGGALLSIVFGSTYVGRRVEQKGWLKGGLTGLGYVFVIIVLGFFLPTGLGLGTNMMLKFFLGFSFGIIGGIIGINS